MRFTSVLVVGLVSCAAKSPGPVVSTAEAIVGELVGKRVEFRTPRPDVPWDGSGRAPFCDELVPASYVLRSDDHVLVRGQEGAVTYEAQVMVNPSNLTDELKRACPEGGSWNLTVDGRSGDVVSQRSFCEICLDRIAETPRGSGRDPARPRP